MIPTQTTFSDSIVAHEMSPKALSTNVGVFMERPSINFPAVLVSAGIMFFFGWVWYTVFADIWMAGTGVTEQVMMSLSGAQMAMAYGGSIVAYVLVFYIMAHVIAWSGSTTAQQGAMVGFYMWVGFVASSLFVVYNYAMRPMTLFFLDGLYWMISMVIGGIVLAVWRKSGETSAKDGVAT